MAIVVLTMMLGACGGASSERATEEGLQARLTGAFGHPEAFEHLLRAPVQYGGLLFVDPQCTRQFPQPAMIDADKLPAFARCLATLPFRMSSRRASLVGSEVLTYEPGIEVDVHLDSWNDGDFIDFIGYSSRVGLSDALPTVDEATFARMTLGDRQFHLDDATRALLDTEARTSELGYEYTWIKVCLDASGTLTSARPRETSSLDASEAFVTAVRAWKFRPFDLAGHPVPVCSMVLATYPPARRPSPEELPYPGLATADDPAVMDDDVRTHRIEGETQVQPSTVVRGAMAQLGLRRLVVLFHVCLDPRGRIASTHVIRSSGSASYDHELSRIMASWRYSPPTLHGQPTAACTEVEFVYTQG